MIVKIEKPKEKRGDFTVKDIVQDQEGTFLVCRCSFKFGGVFLLDMDRFSNAVSYSSIKKLMECEPHLKKIGELEFKIS